MAFITLSKFYININELIKIIILKCLFKGSKVVKCCLILPVFGCHLSKHQVCAHRMICCRGIPKFIYKSNN